MTYIRALNYRCCEVHGPQTLHRDSLCNLCHPAQPKPPVVKPTLTLPKRAPRAGRPAGELNAREIEVVMEVARGQMQKDIAYRLGISRSAVANILRRAMTRVGIKSRWEMYRYVRARAEVRT